MFHKHDDRLQRLNEELLAEDEEHYEEEYEEADDLTEDSLAELLGEEEAEEEPLFCRNAANGYGREIRNFANQYGKGSPKEFSDGYFDEDEDLEDEEFLYRDDYRRAKKHKKKAKKEAKAEKKGGIGLVLLAIIELTAIIGILAWWASWVL